MSHVLTVIAAPRTSTTVASPWGEDLARHLVSALEDAGSQANSISWLAPDEALDIHFILGHFTPKNENALRAVVAGVLDDLPVDFALQPVQDRRKKLLLADMESTIIREELLDEMAREADVSITAGDLTALLYLQGYKREEFVAAPS